MNRRHFLFGLFTGVAGVVAISACDSTGSCNVLSREAEEHLESLRQGYLACDVDSDCVEIPVNASGWCAAACGGLVNRESVQTFVDQATSACEQFTMNGCVEEGAGCPSSGPALCANGRCALASDVLSFTLPSTPLTHGACAVFALDFALPNGSATVTHDTAVALTVSGGSLYADAACADPLGPTGTVTIPAGAHDVTFGFEATTVGTYDIDASGGYLGTRFVVE